MFGRFALLRARASAFTRSASKLETPFSTLSSAVDESRRTTHWLFSNWGKLALAVPPVALGTWIAVADDPSQRASFAIHFPIRLARDLSAVAAIVTGDSV